MRGQGVIMSESWCTRLFYKMFPPVLSVESSAKARLSPAHTIFSTFAGAHILTQSNQQKS